jgi:hypothetical protein
MNRGKFIRTIILSLISLIVCGTAIAQTEIVLKSQDISGGINEYDRESLIADNQSTVLKNANIREGGIARKRDGCVEISGNTTASTVIALANYYKLGDATKRLCVVYGTNMDVYNGTVWDDNVFTDLTCSGALEMFTAGDYLWFVSPNMNTRAYNFTTLTESGNSNGEAPQCSAGIYHKGKVLLWGNGTYRDYLWWSATGPAMKDLMTFDQATNAHKIDSGDNQDLIAVLDYGMSGNEGLIALKEKSTYYIDTSQADPADWSIVKLFNSGCVARRTAQKVGNDIYFLSRDGATYKVKTISRTQYDTINIGNVPLSNPVSDLLADVSDVYISNACAIFYDDYYILAFPSGTSAYNDKIIVYDTQKQSWIEYTGWYPSQFSTFVRSSVEELYFGQDKAFAEIFRAFSGTDDDGTAINYQEESKQWTFDAPEVTKNWKNIEFEFAGQGGHYSPELYIKLDDGDWEQLLNSNGDVLDLYVVTPTLPIYLPFTLVTPGIIRQTYEITEYGRGRGIKWKIVHNETGLSSDFERLGVYLRGWVNKQEWEGEK